MCRIVTALLLVPVLLFSEGIVEKTFNFDTPQIRNEMVYLKDCRISREGFAPSVAVKPVMLALQKGQEAVSFEVNFGEYTTLPGDYYLKPFVPSVSLEKGPHPDMKRCRSEVYDKNEFFPKSVGSKWFRVQYKHGIPIFVTLIKPVQYNPVTGMIRYYSKVSVKVYTKAARTPVTYNCTPASKSLVQALVDNPEATETLPIVKKDGDDYEYLIVSSDGLKDGWSSFVEFNERRCLRSKVVSIADVIAGSTGSDDAEKLRNYIIKEYTDHKITYVMLGGDDNPGSSADIPDREMRAQFYDHHKAADRFHDEKDLSADLYYSCLDGDWKTDSGGTVYPDYGEPGTEDAFWDVYACRFPVANITELTNIINKTIKYSETPVVDEVTNILLLGNFLWTNSGVDVFGGMHMDEYLGTCTANSYTTQGFPTDVWTATKLYESDGSWQVGQLRSQVASTKPTWIEHLGHGNTTLAFEETNSGVTDNNYTNDGVTSNYFIITTGACYPGNFDENEDCLLEKFIRIKNGAVACQGFEPSGLEDDDGTDGVGQRIRRFFHDAIFNPGKQIHHLMMAHGNGKEANAEIILNPNIETPPYFGALRFIDYGFNFFGDPALSFWTDKPETMQPVFSFSGKVFESDTKCPYTWVAIVGEAGNIITTQMTGLDGKCKIDDTVLADYFDAHPDEKLKVRVKALNYLPYEGDIGPTGISNTTDKLAFNPIVNVTAKTVHISYTLPAQGFVSISIYNAVGAEIKAVAEKNQMAGKYSIRLSTNDLSNGIYYCRLKMGRIQSTEKFFVLK